MQFSRRNLIKGVGAAAGLALVPQALKGKSSPNVESSFSYCLNTSTIMGQQLGIVKEVEIAAEAGYDGIEVWVNSVSKYVSD